MAVVSFFSMWLAVLVLSVFFACRKAGCCSTVCVKDKDASAAGAAVPLCVVCGVILVLFACGCAGVLRLGAWLVLMAGAAAAGWLAVAGLRQRGHKEAALAAALRGCVCPAWLVAFGGSAVLAVFLAVRQPLFRQWDEFSFWGTAANAVWQHDALYTLVEQTNLEARSYPPALPLLSYAFSFLADRFAPWLLYAAYGVLSFSVFGAVTGLAGRSAAPAAFGAMACVLAPFAVECWSDGQVLNAYVTAYSDQILGILTAGGCAVWLCAVRPADGPLRGGAYAAALAGTALVTAVLGLVKDVGLPLGLVVFLVCVLDHFCNDFLRCKKDARAWLRLVGVGAALAATAALAYMVWARHLAAALAMDRSETGGSAGLSTAGMLVSGVRELLGIGRTEKFAAVLSAMIQAVFTRRVTVFGTGAMTVAVIAVVLLAAFLLARRGQRRRVVSFALASGTGFAGYWFFQLICYVYVFSEADGRGLVSYPRYMGIYYLFWLLGALAVLLCAAKGRFGGLGVMAAGILLLLCCWLRIDAEDTFLQSSPVQWELQTVVEQRAQQAREAAAAAPEPDRVLVVTQWDDGGRWYRYACALEPLPLYHVDGDGTIVSKEEPGEFALRLDRSDIAAFLKANDCTLLVADVLDYYFCMEFAPLFTDALAGYENGTCHVYRVEYTDGGDGVVFVPWKEALHV